jgi:2-oxoglutarate dehydrogenase E1 component
MGFEYGYSLDCPDGFVAWEAQFGDFINAGQVIIDQFIASAEAKWQRLSGLVLLLPHGFEGQGPEHSSARLERFLTLAAEDNIQVVYPTTPAQYFHCLRRQALRLWRKPLVVMTPKGLLRHRDCVSTLEELASGRFHDIQDDPELAQEKKNDGRVLLCTGEFYYELEARRREVENDVAAIIRIEQLYPFPVDAIAGALAKLPDEKAVTWAQEEPENMGAWRYMQTHWLKHFPKRPLTCISRPASASPATGSKTAHDREQRHLLDRAVGEHSG